MKTMTEESLQEMQDANIGFELTVWKAEPINPKAKAEWGICIHSGNPLKTIS